MQTSVEHIEHPVVLSVVLHVSLAQVADGMTIDVYRCIFVFFADIF